MLRGLSTFRGEAPRVAAHLLPDNAAQEAVNARLLTGNLTPWKQFALTQILANTGPVQTIYLLNDAWLSWDAQVDVARGIIPGDTTYRTYLTAPSLYAQPRFTNYALATTGSAPYPVTTRPLGVPNPDAPPTLEIGVDPAATTYSVDITDSGGQLSTNWTTSPLVNAGSTYSSVTEEGGSSGRYKLTFDENLANPAYMYRNFSFSSASVAVVTFDAFYEDYGGRSSGSFSQFAAGIMASGSATNSLQVHVIEDSPGVWYLAIVIGQSWSVVGSVLQSTPITALAPLTVYSIQTTVVVNSDGTQTVTAKMYNGVTLMGQVTVTNSFTLGGYVGFIGEASLNAGSRFKAVYDNIHVQASGSTGYVPTSTATSYVYTLVNDLGEQSGPSQASATILRPDGVSVTVTTPTGVPTGISVDYTVTTKRIYRAATGNTGTEFLFVAEIPLSTASYVDVLTDAELGEVLESTGWDLPPDDLEGILALPNGVMVGFRRNQLCLSAQNRPHAWPPLFRLNTDTNIVGLGNVDTTVVIFTESFIYVASGSDPATYSMSKFEVPQAGSSKRSIAYLTNIGVVGAGPDGLMAVAGIGQVRNLTDTVFTRDQWQALGPESMLGVAHNDIYFLFWEAGSSQGCYAIDMKPTGFGVVDMAFHATAAYVDPIEDKMYLALDTDNEPDDPSLPIRPTFSLNQTASDPYWSSVLYLHHFDDVASPTTIVDEQGNTWTRNSFSLGVLAAQGTTVKFGSGSLRAANVSGSVPNITRAYASTPLDASGENKFTIDGWMLASTNGVSALGFRLTSGDFCEINIQAHVVTFKAFINGSARTTAGWAIDSNWHFVEANYDGATMRLFGDGVLRASLVVAPGSALSLDTGRIGMTSASVPDQVFVDEARLTLGVARHPADTTYSVPTAAFPDTSTSIAAPAVYEFEGNPSDHMVYRWLSKLWLLERPAWFTIAQVRAADFANLLLRVYGDGVQIDEIVIENGTEFTLVEADEYETLQFEVLGTSTVRVIQAAEDVTELV